MDRNPRYDRHYQLAGFGAAAQEKLEQAAVLVVGAGGLGCPVLQYLTAAGVGRIGIVDHDTIEINNLQRQVLFATGEIGLPKAETAARKLRNLNPEITIEAHVLRLSAANAAGLVVGYDVVVDCTDNFTTRYLLGDCCRLLDKPLVFGAIFRYEGQVAVFNVAGPDGVKTTYRHLFPTPPGAADAPDCNTAGVLGVLPGTIGTLQATEVIKIITGTGEPLYNRLMTINLLDYSTLILDIPSRITGAAAGIPGTLGELEMTDYDTCCAAEVPAGIGTVSSDRFNGIATGKDTLVIDVRNPDELPRLSTPHTAIPLPELEAYTGTFDSRNIVVVCQSGQRSLAAAALLRKKLDNTYTISHLEGGIASLQQI